MKHHQLNSFQTSLLENIEYILDYRRFGKNQYLISRIKDKEHLSLEALLSYSEISKLKPTMRDLQIVLKSSSWLRLNVSGKSAPMLKLPFQIDTKTLILYDLPKMLKKDDIDKFIRLITGESNFTLKKRDNEFLVTFQTPIECVAFWRALGVCMIKGHLIDGKIMISKPIAKPAPMGRSQSMNLQKFSKPEKLPRLKIEGIKVHQLPNVT